MSFRTVLSRMFFFALVTLGLCGSAGAEEFYYVMIFGSQSHPKQLRYTHTWATFVKATGEGPDANAYALEYATISWLPATLKVKVWNPRPEQGVNLGLYETLNALWADHENVTMWGPFRIAAPVYQRALQVKALAESGRAKYRAISNARNMLISDCIHAVAAVDPIMGRSHYPLIRVGKPASRYIARQIMTRSIFDQYSSDNSWLVGRFGIDRMPIEVIKPQQIPKKTCFLCLIPE